MSITFKDTAADSRTALGFGTASTLDVGTSANNILQLDSSGKLPALNATNLIGAIPVNTPSFLVRPSSNGTFTNTTWVNVGALMNYKEFDTASGFSATDSGKYTVSTAGVYHIIAQADCNAGDSSFNNAQLAIYKNGTLISSTKLSEAGEWGERFCLTTQWMGSCSVDDYLQFQIYTSDTSGSMTYTAINTYFAGFKIF